MSEPLVGIQPIIYGGRLSEEPEAVLDEIAASGYRGVEAPNLFGRYGEATVKRWFTDRGLVIPATHTGYGAVADQDQLNSTLDFLESVGGRYVICSGTKDQTAAGYDASAETFNQAGEACRERGLRFLYHNHDWEFKPLDDAGDGGARGIDRLLAGTDPELVGLNIDVYWVTLGNDDPETFIRRHADRGGYFHFKDGYRDDDGKPVFLPLGQGKVDLARALAAARAVGCHWVTYEQDRHDGSPVEALQASRDCLRSLGV